LRSIPEQSEWDKVTVSYITKGLTMEENKSNNMNKGPSSSIWLGFIFIGAVAIVLLNQTFD